MMFLLLGFIYLSFDKPYAAYGWLTGAFIVIPIFSMPSIIAYFKYERKVPK